MTLVGSLSDIFGYVSIFFWLGAQFPQILENIKQQSCESIALPFLFNWMLGDASNLIGCILTNQLPFQTYLATYFCFIDCCLLTQYFYYGGSPKSPPIVYPYTRSRNTSSVRPHSLDASHYRILSTAVGNIATHPETHSEHRRPKKLTEEPPIDGQSITQLISEEPQDEVNDAVLSSLSESFFSEGGRRKRVSWSQERLDHPSGGSSRHHMSPVVSATLRHTPSATAALLARGRPLQREEDTEDLEQVLETDRREASRASRRSAGMVLLGAGLLFGIGYIGGMQPMVGRGAKTGMVLVPTSIPKLSVPTDSPLADKLPNHFADSHPVHADIELPSPPQGTEFSQQRQPDGGMSYQRLIGRISAWLCAVLYLTSRLPQIWKNYVRKSVEGLSMYLFVLAFLGNFFYVLSILTSPLANLPPPASTAFLRESLPYLLGSGGTFMFDITIVTQSFIYKGKHPRRNYIRSRGNSVVRSAAHAEETAGLLRGDALAATRAHSERPRADSGVGPRSLSRS